MNEIEYFFLYTKTEAAKYAVFMGGIRPMSMFSTTFCDTYVWTVSKNHSDMAYVSVR